MYNLIYLGPPSARVGPDIGCAFTRAGPMYPAKPVLLHSGPSNLLTPIPPQFSTPPSLHELNTMPLLRRTCMGIMGGCPTHWWAYHFISFHFISLYSSGGQNSGTKSPYLCSPLLKIPPPYRAFTKVSHRPKFPCGKFHSGMET